MFTITDLASDIYKKFPHRVKNEKNAQNLVKIYFKWIETCIQSDRFYDVQFGKLGYFAMKKVLRKHYISEEDIERLRKEKTNVTKPKILLNPGEKYRNHIKNNNIKTKQDGDNNEIMGDEDCST